MDSDVLSILGALSDAHVRYLVVGGVAVVLHGYGRMTADLDLIVDLEEGNALAAVRAFEGIGFRARAPVPLAAFADRHFRKVWVEEKGLTVLSLWNPKMPMTEVGLFVTEPLDFGAAFQRAVHLTLANVKVIVVSLEDLILLKRGAARDKDLADIRILEQIKRSKGGT